MYLTIMHPEVVPLLKEFGVGLWAAKVDKKYFLIIKAPKEIILTAKINQGFHFYLAPVEIDSKSTFTLITAFFDDDDEPLIIMTPLLANDAPTNDFLELLHNDVFEVFFFDEHDRELLSYKASGCLTLMRDRIISTPLLSADAVRQMLYKAENWFGLRDERDDEEATAVTLVERLFPDDFVIMDLEDEKHLFHGSKSFSSNSLERDEPGSHQELDIVFLLERVYEPKRIFLNPIKAVDGEELVDVMVVGDEAVLLLQAKDSPNTEKILRTTVKRKRIKSLKKLKEGASQLSGAIGEIKRNPLIRLSYGEGTIEVDLSERQLIGVVVVKELFNDSFEEYSSVMFELMDKTETPAVFFDYPELSLMTLHCNCENKFLNAAHQIFSFAMEHGEFPRLRYSGAPSS
jgi:hypothetical protein